MTEQDEELVVKQGRIAGCRGRVLVAVIVVGVLFLLLLFMLVRGMLSGTPPQPVRRAAASHPPAQPVAAWLPRVFHQRSAGRA